VTTEITKKGIASVGNIKDPDTRRVLTTLIEAFQMLQGAQGKVRDRALRVSDLVNLGLIAVSSQDDLYDPNKPIIPAFNDHHVAPTGFTGIFACVESSTGHTVHIFVDNGEVIGYSGGFEALDVATMTTITITVAAGLLIPVAGTFDVLDPHTGTTLTMTVTSGRILQFV